MVRNVNDHTLKYSFKMDEAYNLIEKSIKDVIKSILMPEAQVISAKSNPELSKIITS